MKEYTASTLIQASPETIWSILTDIAAYPEWDPFCDKIEGHIAPGATIKAYSKLAPGRAFKVRVTELTPQQKMVWSGGMPFGLFKGERSFTLKQENAESVRFTLREVFSGPMLRLIGKSIPDMTEAFSAFASGLKNRSEAKN